jgi:hypothetical protein
MFAEAHCFIGNPHTRALACVCIRLSGTVAQGVRASITRAAPDLWRPSPRAYDRSILLAKSR